MTIRDVAARAGVSAATVSRVFSRPESVTVETRQRVLSAADELRYAPHPVARSLARGSTGNLGLVVPDIAVAFCAVVTKAVSQRARLEGYALFVADSDDASARLVADDLRSARAMARQVDGLLLLSPTHVRRRPARPRRHDSSCRDQPGAGRRPGRPHAQCGRRAWQLSSTCTPSGTAGSPTWPGPTTTPTVRGPAAFLRTCGRLDVAGVVLVPSSRRPTPACVRRTSSWPTGRRACSPTTTTSPRV